MTKNRPSLTEPNLASIAELSLFLEINEYTNFKGIVKKSFTCCSSVDFFPLIGSELHFTPAFKLVERGQA